MSTWYYMKDGTRTGPVTTEELTALLSAGSLRVDTLIWREGFASWVAASTVPEFASAIPASSTGLSTPLPMAGASSPSGGPGVEIPDPADVEKNKVFGVLCYLPPFLFIVALLTARQSKFAMYHCNQGLVLTITAFATSIAMMILGVIPVLGWILAPLLGMALWIGVLVLAIMGIINSAQGACKPLPLIGDRFTLVK